MMYSRSNRGPRNPRNTDPQNPNAPGSDTPRENRPDTPPENGNREGANRTYGNRDNNRPTYGNRDNRPYGDRPSRPPYGGGGDRPSYGNRDNRPSYGGGGDRPSYGNRDNRPYGDRPSRPPYGGGNDRPSYGNRDNRPSYNNRDSRPPYGGGGDRPSRPYGGGVDRPSRPPFGGNRDSRPSYGDRDRRPSYGDRDRRPSYGDRDRRPSYGDRDRRPSYGDRDRRGPGRGPARGGPAPVKDNRISLPRAIARLGFTSRNLAIDIIKEGRVRVDDRVITNPSVRLTPQRNLIYVDDVCINKRRPRVYIMMHKPKGLVTSREEIAGRKTIYSVLPNKQEWYFPIGRLDKNTSGLLILTNDSHLANPATSPFIGIERTYMAKLNKEIAEDDLKKIRKGVKVDGTTTKLGGVKHVKSNKRTCWLELSVTDANTHMVRKVFKTLGYEVLTLVRSKIGAMELGTLPIGSWRELTEVEIGTLYGGTMPEHFAVPPTEDEIKIASGELEVLKDKDKKKKAKAAAAPPAIQEEGGEG